MDIPMANGGDEDMDDIWMNMFNSYVKVPEGSHEVQEDFDGSFWSIWLELRQETG